MINARNWFIAALLISIAIAVTVCTLKMPATSGLPEGFAAGNSRIEAIAVDIATKNGGRVAKIAVDEGDWVKTDQLLAQMDTEELEADLNVAQANLRRTEQSKRFADAVVIQRESELTLARKELNRSRQLVAQGNISRELLDQRESQQRSREAALQAASVQVAEALAAIEAAEAQLRKTMVRLKDSTLVSPRDGRVLYRLAEPGEVLGLGGKVITIVDLSDVYMTLFLPTRQASRVSIGAEARIVLDALPDISIPAKVSFIAPRSQFTPRTVETRTEREKLMFRIKIKIDAVVLDHYAERVKTGVPGMAYVQLDVNARWPDDLPPILSVAETTK